MQEILTLAQFSHHRRIIFSICKTWLVVRNPICIDIQTLMFTTIFTCGNMNMKPWLYRNTAALIPIEGIGAVEGCG